MEGKKTSPKTNDSDASAESKKPALPGWTPFEGVLGRASDFDDALELKPWQRESKK
mgnify:CR=1 FL=1